ncbi:threonine/serine dehydratase [candidate division KSB1 bacterium]|nr:threonine/serine dehydratase [candidate division KSB1 bacterium]
MRFDLSSEGFVAARQRIAPYVRRTPLLPPPRLHGDPFPRVHLKLENLQVGGSFKARGVFNHLLQLHEEQRKRGVITASGGNHGVALAYAAHCLNLPAIVYLPTRASDDRVTRIATWGAQIFKHGRDWDDANFRALEHAEQENIYYVHPFDAEATLAGQGTLGLELLEDLPELDCALIAIGGGGLICGAAAAIKQRRPHVHVIGVEPVGAPSMTVSVNEGRVKPLQETRTIADTLAPRSVSERTLALAQRYIDEIVLVEEAKLIEAMRWLWRECNQLVEPAGAAVIAALLQNEAMIAQFKQPVAVICGGNAAAESVFGNYQNAIR